VVLGPLHARLLAGADVAVARRGSFLAVDVRLAGLERAHLAVRQRAAVAALLDALLLIQIALDVGLHALGRLRIGIAVGRVVTIAIDVAARLVLHLVDARLLGRRQLAVFQIARLRLVDPRLLALDLAGLSRVELTLLEPLLDARLLIHVTVDYLVRARSVRERARRDQQSAESD
jgi:hypothetical protein